MYEDEGAERMNPVRELMKTHVHMKRFIVNEQGEFHN